MEVGLDGADALQDVSICAAIASMPSGRSPDDG
jgi:hypothetical protein